MSLEQRYHTFRTNILPQISQNISDTTLPAKIQFILTFGGIAIFTLIAYYFTLIIPYDTTLNTFCNKSEENLALCGSNLVNLYTPLTIYLMPQPAFLSIITVVFAKDSLKSRTTQILIRYIYYFLTLHMYYVFMTEYEHPNNQPNTKYRKFQENMKISSNILIIPMIIGSLQVVLDFLLFYFSMKLICSESSQRQRVAAASQSSSYQQPV